MQTTALESVHVAAGARMVPFAGWNMPVQYRGILEEAKTVREHAGLFDLVRTTALDSSAVDAVISRVLGGAIDVRSSGLGSLAPDGFTLLHVAAQTPGSRGSPAPRTYHRFEASVLLCAHGASVARHRPRLLFRVARR